MNANGQREILGIDVFTSEDGAGWTSFLRGLAARGLSGVRLSSPMTTSASYRPSRRCCRERLTTLSGALRPQLTDPSTQKSAQTLAATLVRSIFAQPDLEAVSAQQGRIVALKRFSDAAALLAEARSDVLAFACFPCEHWRQIWSNNPQERLNREVRRRTDVVGIFPDRAAIVRLVGAMLAEQHDQWLVARRYPSAESLKAAQMATTEEKEVVPELAAVS